MNRLDIRKKLNFAIVGYGKMGKLIATVAARRGHSVVCTVDPQGNATFPSLSSLIDGGDFKPAMVAVSEDETLTSSNTPVERSSAPPPAASTEPPTDNQRGVTTPLESLPDDTVNTTMSTTNTITNDDIDVFIDFSTPDSFKNSVSDYGRLQKPVVVGTTGWSQQQNDILSLLKEQGVPVLYGSNFSIGVQLFIRLVAEASKLFSDLTSYDFAIVEQHHNQKLDNPSGTALSIAEAVVANHSRFTEVVTDSAVVPNQPHQLHVAGVRVGTVPGTHTVYIDSQADTITLQHTARSREGFALGAVLGAEWLIGKSGCFAISDFINEIRQS